MNLREAWKLSKIPYAELVYKSTQLVSGAARTDQVDAPKSVKSTLRSAKLNKAMFSLFGCLGAAIPFATNPSPISLFSAISLSLLVGFAYILLFSLQVLPSFSGADAYSLLLSLPFKARDYSLTTTLSFLRTFDYLAIGTILVPFAAVAVLTGSAIASLLMLGAAVINVVLAVSVGLWLSRLFNKNLTRGGRSRGGSILRTVFIVAWGFAVVSVGFAFQLVTSVLPLLHQIVTGGLSESSGLVLLVLHPFALGLAISSFAYPNSFSAGGLGAVGTQSLGPVADAATVAYVFLAFLAARWAARVLSSISHGQALTTVRETATEFTLKVTRPLTAFVLKDIRASSKSPSTAMVFVLPTFGVLVFFVAISKGSILSAYDVLILTLIASSFALTTGVLLLNAETRGQYYALSLPIGRGIMVESKALVSTLTFLPVPLVLAVIQLLGSGTLRVVSLVPFLEVLSVGAAPTAEIAILMGGRGAPMERGSTHGSRPHGLNASAPQQAPGFSVISGYNTGQMLESVILALLVVLAPLVSYLATFSLGYAATVSMMTMVAVVIVELMLTFVIVRAANR